MKLLWLTRRAACLATVVVVAAGAGWSAPAPTSGVLEYEEQYTRAGQPVRKVTTRIWFSGEKFRRETTMPRGKSIQIGGPEEMFILSPGQKEAMKAPRFPRPGSFGRRPGGIPGMPFMDLSMIQRSMKKVGSEKIGRYQADIYEPRQFVTRYWVSPDVPVPVKTVTKGPDFENVQTLKSAQFDVPIAANLLELPKGTKVREMPMPPFGQGAPGGFGRPGPMAATASALSNAKQLALGVMMYAQDYNRTLPPMRDAASFQKSLMPYIKNPQVFKSPATGRPFQPNAALSEKKLNSLKNAAATVVLYSAVPEPGGTHIVAYADGRVQAVAGQRWTILAQEQKLPAR